MIIRVHIQPGAKQNEIVGRYGDAVKIRLQAPPIEGRANKALIEFLAKKIGIPKSSIKITHGQSSRNKTLSLDCSSDLILKVFA